MELVKQLLIKSRIILQSNYFIAVILLFTIIFCFIKINSPIKSYYNSDTKSITGIVTNIKTYNDYSTLTVKAKENVLVYIEGQVNFKLGITIKIFGTLETFEDNRIFNLYNYKNYYLCKKIIWKMNANSYKVISYNTSIYYKIKNNIINYINSKQNSKYYLAFILGDQSKFSNELKDAISNIGISHIFALSGMHLGLFTTFILMILKRINFKHYTQIYILIIILFFYVIFTSLSVSIIRAYLFLLIFNLNKIFDLKFSKLKLYFYILIGVLLYNPWYIYNLGFLYSFLICFYLLKYKDLINSKNKFSSIFKISLLAFFVSIPVNLYYFFELNLLSVFFNLIFVPLITFIIFPLILISFILPIFEPITYFFTNILEKLIFFCNNFNLNFTFMRINIIFYILIEVLIYCSLEGIKRSNYYYLLIFLFCISLYYFYPNLDNRNIVTFIDVGQGDSTLIKYKNNLGNILIDTGVSNNGVRINNEIIPYLKSLGIKKLDYLILTHGDSDHLGDALYLVNEFKVDKVILNVGVFNESELELIKVLKQKNISYYQNIEELNIGSNKVYFLNTKDYNDENENSSVIYTEIDNVKLLLMGDAGVKREEDILNIYNLNNIDVLKVGHHGSKTSSSINFINNINPVYGIISVGVNNLYGHPNNEVLNNLEKVVVYRTDYNGSVMFVIGKDKLNIYTCLQ